MKKIQVKTAKKIGLIYAISILIGTVVGVGIFLKNISVFNNNNYNFIAIIVSWAIAGIISFCTAWSFAEVGSSAVDNSGLASWISKLLNKKFGKFVTLIQPFLYYSLISFSISIFASESIFKLFDFNASIHIGLVILLGVSLQIIFITLNFVKFNIAKNLQLVLSILKILPILLVLGFGVAYAILQPSASLINNNNIKVGEFNFVNIIVSLPAILFSFDSFLGVGNLSTDIAKPKRNVPLTIIIGMGMVVVVYLLVTFSLVFTGNGNALSIFNTATFLSSKAANIINVIFTSFLFISIIGVVNGFSSICIRGWEAIIDHRVMYKSEQFKNLVENKMIKKHYENRCGFVLSLISLLLFCIIFAIPSIIRNTDAYIDGVSNFPTTIFFGIYALAIIGGMKNRLNKKVDVYKIKCFWFTSCIAVLGCFFVLLFQVFYSFSFKNINDAYDSANWGLFYSHNVVVPVWESSIWFAVYFILIALVYGINQLLIYLDNKKQDTSIIIESNQIIWNAIEQKGNMDWEYKISIRSKNE